MKLRLAANFGTDEAPLFTGSAAHGYCCPGHGPAQERMRRRKPQGRAEMPNVRIALHAGIAAAMLLCGAAAALAEEPIKIGFSMELTGPFAVVGKTGLLAFKIWEEEVNAEGGLLGRPVKLIYYDDQSNPSLVPGIYTKLIEIGRAHV